MSNFSVKNTNNNVIVNISEVPISISCGVTPSGLAILANNLYAYVANNNNYSIAGEDSVSVLDIINNIPFVTINHASFNGPYTITINSAQTKAYVTNSSSNSISVIDLTTNTVSNVITGFDGPSGFCICGEFGFANNYGYSSGIFTASISGTTMTVSAISQGVISLGQVLTTSGSFTGSISTTVLTVTAIASGAVAIGAMISGSGVTGGTTIISFGTGTGGTGTYNISISQTVSATTISSVGAAGKIVTSNSIITGYGTGSGGIGTYTISISQNVASTVISVTIPGVQSGNGASVQKVDLSTELITGSQIIVGTAPAAITALQNGAYVYTANYVDGNTNTGTLSKIKVSDNTVTTIGPFSSNGFSGPFAIVLNSTGTRAYVTNFGSNNFSPFSTTLSVINLANSTIVSTVTIGIQPAGCYLTLSQKYIYVTTYNTLYSDGNNFTGLTAGQGKIWVIDANSGVIVTSYSCSQSPSAVVLSPDQTNIYASCYIGGCVTKIPVIYK